MSLSANARRGTLWASTGAGVTVFLALLLPLLTGLVYFGLDLSLIDVPINCALSRQIQGHESLWLSTYMGNGAPFATRPSAQFFYPLHWLALLFSPELSASLLTILHLALASAGVAALLRSFGGKPWTAYWGGVIFALSGTSLNLIVHSNTFVTGVAYLPWAWAFARWSLRPRRAGSSRLGLGLSLSAMLLGGAPQLYLMAATLVSVESLVQLWRNHRWRPSIATLALVPASFAVGLLLWGGFFAESAIVGRRLAGLDPAEALRWSYDAPLWLATLIPPLPDTGLQSYFWGRIIATYPDSWNPNPYLGMSLATLSLIGLGIRRARVASLALFVSLLLATGMATPLGPALLSLVPRLGMFRYPQKYFVLANIVVVITAALVVQRSQASPKWRRRAVLALGSTLLGAGLLSVLFALGSWSLSDPWALQLLRSSTLKAPGIFADFSSIQMALLKILQGLLWLSLVLVLLRFRPERKSWIWALLALDLFVASVPTLNIGERLLDLVSPLQFLQNKTKYDDINVLCNHRSSYFSSFDEANTPIWTKTALYRIYQVSEFQACDGLHSAVPYSPIQTGSQAKLYFEFSKGEIKAAQALGCSHLLINADVPAGLGVTRMFLRGAADAQANINQGPRLYRLDWHLPKTFLSSHPQFFQNQDKALDQILLGNTPDDLMNIIDDPAHQLSPGQILPEASADVAISQLDWPRQDRATLTLSGQGGAVVGLRTVFQVGWQAQQAGQALTVVRIGAQHVGVVVDDVSLGPVQLEYKSPYFVQSVIAAILGLLSIVLLAFWPQKKS